MSWRESKYDASMCDKLVESYSRGDTKAMFCSDVNISVETFHEWLHTHADFKEAYRLARGKAQAVYDAQIKHSASTTQLPHDHIRKMHKMRFHDRYSEDLLSELEPSDLERTMKKLLDFLRVGRITPDEFVKMSYALTDVNAALNDHLLAARLERVEQALALKAEQSQTSVTKDGVVLAEPDDASNVSSRVLPIEAKKITAKINEILKKTAKKPTKRKKKDGE